MRLPHDWSEFVTLAWLAVLGSAVGSFLNVVGYRLPRGKSLVHPGSRCPACDRAIRWHDNVPVFGWLRLRGRCRDCGAPISSRYPIVEALVGVIFAVLGWFEVLSDSGLSSLAFDASGRCVSPWAVYAFHLLLICTLLSAALIDLDGQRLPNRLYLPVLLAGLLLAAVWPELRPTAISWRFPLAPADDALASQLEGVLGCSVGALFGLLVWPCTGFGAAGSAGRTEAAWELMLVGGFLGWAAVGEIAAAAMILLLLSRILALAWARFGAAGWAIWLTVATIGWIIGWSIAAGQSSETAKSRLAWEQTGLIWLIQCGAAVAVLALVTRPVQQVLARRQGNRRISAR